MGLRHANNMLFLPALQGAAAQGPGCHAATSYPRRNALRTTRVLSPLHTRPLPFGGTKKRSLTRSLRPGEGAIPRGIKPPQAVGDGMYA